MRRTVGSKPFPYCVKDYFSSFQYNLRKGVNMSKRLTTKEFIDRAIKVHGDKYDYSQTIYINAKTKVKIKCKKHGIFVNKFYCSSAQ